MSRRACVRARLSLNLGSAARHEWSGSIVVIRCLTRSTSEANRDAR